MTLQRGPQHDTHAPDAVLSDDEVINSFLKENPDIDPGDVVGFTSVTVSRCIFRDSSSPAGVGSRTGRHYPHGDAPVDTLSEEATLAEAYKQSYDDAFGTAE